MLQLPTVLYRYYCPLWRRQYCFSIVTKFFLCYHDNLTNTALNLTELCTDMHLYNRTNPIEFQGHRSKIKVTGPDFRISHHCE